MLQHHHYLFQRFFIATCILIFFNTNFIFGQSASVTSGCAPLTVNFDNGSVAGPWLWNLGGTNSTLEDPSRVFTAAGTYTIELNGSFVTTITVYANPVANFGTTDGITSGCASASSPLTINFQDTSTSTDGSINSWLWDFGDGNSSTQQNPTHSYTNSGVYTVTLRVVTQFGCEHTIVKTDFINANGSANVDFNPRFRELSCEAPFSVQFTNTSTGLINPNYTWEVFEYDPGHPQGIGTQLTSLTTNTENPLIVFPNEGEYTVRLSVNDDSGCATERVRKRIVVIESYILGFNYSLAPSLAGQCIPVQGSFSLTPGSNVDESWQTLIWEFLDVGGNVIGTISGQANDSFARNPIFNFPAVGTYTVRLSARGRADRDDCPQQVYDTQTITIDDLPIPDFTSTNNSSCQVPLTVNFDASASVGAISYAWDFDNDGTIDFTDTNPTASFTYTAFGDYNVRLIVTDANGCEVELIKESEVQISEITADLVALQPIGCNDTNGDFIVNFRDRSNSPVDITQWTWEFFDEGGSSVGTISGTDPDIHQNPSFTFNTDPTVNEGKAQYSVQLTIETAEGCVDDTLYSNYIKVGNLPMAKFSSNPPFGCAGTNVDFTYEGSMPYDSLYWYPFGAGVVDGLTIRYPGDDPNFSFAYDGDPNVYIADLIVWNGGCSDTTDYQASEPLDPKFQQFLPRALAAWYRDDCEPSNIYFVDESLGPQSWRWDFGDGSPLIEGTVRDFLPSEVPREIRNPNHAYASPGTYTVTLEIAHDNIFYVLDSNGDRIKNNTFLTTGNPHTYTTNEDGDLLLFGDLVTEDSVRLVRCTDDITLTVVVPDFPNIEANISSDHNPNAQNCVPFNINFQDMTNDPEVVAWYWSLGNGQVSYEQNPSATYTKSGKYTIELVVTTNRGCKYRRVFPDYVVANGPEVNFEYCESDACIDDPTRTESPPVEGIRFRDLSSSRLPIQYRTWDMGNGTIFSTDPSVSGTSTPPAGAETDLSEFVYEYPQSFPNRQIDGFEVTLTVTDEVGCQSTKLVKVRPTLPEASDFNIDAFPFGCDSDSLRIDGVSGLNGFDPFMYTFIVQDNLGVEVDRVGPRDNPRADFVLPGDLTSTPVAPKTYTIIARIEDAKHLSNPRGCYTEIAKTYTVAPVPPEPDFAQAIVGTSCGNASVQFNDLSVEGSRGGVAIPITEWFWEFGDGTISNEQNPLKIYTSPGTYIPQLTITDEAGCQLTKVADSPVVVQGTTAILTAVKVSGTDPNPITPITSGTITDFIQAVSGTVYTVGFSVINVNDISAVGSFVWDFGDGVVVTTPNTTTSVNHDYINPGVYLPTLSIIDATDPTCQYPIVSDITIVANGCNPPSILPIADVCPGTQITLTAMEPVGNAFNPINPPFSNPVWTNTVTGNILPTTVGVDGSGNTIYTTQVIISDTTSFSFSIDDAVTPVACTSTANITVNTLPITTVEAGSDQSICSGGNIALDGILVEGVGDYTYQWTSFPDIGTFSGSVTFTGTNTAIPTVNYTNITSSTVFTLTLTPSSGQACSTLDNISIDVNDPPIANAGADVSICSGTLEVNGSATGGLPAYTYEWIAPSGLESTIADANQANTFITFATNNTGSDIIYTYQLKVTDANGCENIDDINVTVKPDIIITGYANTNICNGDAITLTGNVTGGSGDFTYQWISISGSGLGSLSATDVANPVASPTQTTTYSLLVIDNILECTATTTVQIVVNPEININASNDQTVCINTSGIVLNATASGGTESFTYQWTPSTFLDDPTSLTPTVNGITTTTEYTLTVTDLDAGGNPNCSVEDRVTIFVSEPFANAGTNQNICEGESTNLQGSGNSGTAPYLYTWTLDSYTGSGTLADIDGLLDADVTAQISNPQFLADNPAGTYIYRLTISDAGSCISTNDATVSIIVNPQPGLPTISGDLGYCEGETINLTASGLASAIFRWYAQDPIANPTTPVIEVGSTLIRPAIANVTYFVTQEDANTGCVSDVASVTVNVGPIPPAPTATNPPDYCPEDTPVLTATGTNIKWYRPLGTEVGTGSPFNPSIDMDVSVTTTYTFYATQTILGCESPETEVVITVHPTPPTPNVTTNEACEDVALSNIFTVSSPDLTGTYTWYEDIDGDGNPITQLATGTTFTPSVAPDLSNNGLNYYVTLTLLGCESEPREVTLIINPKPDNPSLASNEPQYCEGEEIIITATGLSGATFRWYEANPDVDPSLIPVQESTSTTFTTTATIGTTPSSYFVTQENPSTGCISLAEEIEIIIFPIPSAPVAPSPSSYCPESTLLPLEATGEDIKWYDATNTQVASGNSFLPSVSLNVTVTTTYTFYATQTINECESPRTEVIITVHPTPDAPIVIENPICENTPVLNVFSIDNPNLSGIYTWYQSLDNSGNPISELATGTGFNPSVSATLSNNGLNYYVTLTLLGCESEPTEVTLTVNPRPTLDYDENLRHCFETDGAATIDAGEGLRYLWFDGTTGRTTEVNFPGIYTFRVFNEFDCFETGAIQVTDLCAPRLFVPTAFTPNGDGKNDVFQAFGKYLSNLQIRIFNQWGEIIHITEGLSDTWDGTYRGQDVQMGTYVWKATYFNILEGKFEEDAGTVSVIR